MTDHIWKYVRDKTSALSTGYKINLRCFKRTMGVYIHILCKNEYMFFLRLNPYAFDRYYLKHVN